MDDVVAELTERLASRPDYITLSGSGEPTLYSRLAELIGRIRSITDIPVAVLTNGSLLWQKDVREQLMDAHLVIPSLDASDNPIFQAVNRPHADISFEQMVEGLIAFRNEYHGQYWLEVFLLAGHTAIPAEVKKIAELVSRIKPDRVQLNTVTRPPAEDYAMSVDRKALETLAAIFDPPAEVIADFRNIHSQSEFAAGRETVLQMLQRRPCSVDDLATGLGIHRNEAVKYVEELITEGRIENLWCDGKLHYRASRGSASQAPPNERKHT